MKVLNVRNIAQKVLLENELFGQISDGMWENTSPNDHWEVWSECKVVVDENNLGRNFYARKDNYNLNSSSLLEIVGDRMLAYVRIAKHLNIEKLPSCLNWIAWSRKYPTTQGEYYDNLRSELSEYPVETIIDVANDESAYSMKDMKKDLADLKKIFKTKI